jgi:quercetin dioxygenase-like cupin family protein
MTTATSSEGLVETKSEATETVSPEALRTLLEAGNSAAAKQLAIAAGPRALAALSSLLHEIQPLHEVERVEEVLKAWLVSALARRLTPSEALSVMEFQRGLGLLFKSKPYGLKASSALGYSLFLLNPGEGFSFQRHRTHKTEIFHILEVSAAARVFLCSSAQWEECFDPTTFGAWLDGEPNPDYERFSLKPEPGDVIVIDDLDVVHSVVGCVLEEFAATSVDLVDRLYDQNQGRDTPLFATRSELLLKTRSVVATHPKRQIRLAESGLSISYPYRPKSDQPGVDRLELGHTSSFMATRWHIDPGHRSEWIETANRAVSLYTLQGNVEVSLGGGEETGITTPTCLRLLRGESALVAPGQRFYLSCLGTETAVVSEHSIAPEAALN